MSRSISIAAVVLLSAGSAWGQSGDPPVGSVVAWLASFENVPVLADSWVECSGQVLDDPQSPFNGQTIPDLNGQTVPKRFLRGAPTSGGLGGSESHGHSIPGTMTTNTGEQMSIAGFQTDQASSLPPYYEVVWIMKVKSSPGSVPAVSEWGVAILLLLSMTLATIMLARRRRVA